MNYRLFFFLTTCVFFSACRYSVADKNESFLITNVEIVDGSGGESYPGAIRIRGDRIEAVGDLQPEKGETVIDGGGQVLAPGFIDTHSHHDGGMFEKRTVPEVVSQGITTIIVGQDGFSEFPIAGLWRQLDSLPVAVNVGSYVGHNTLREEIVGDSLRPATPLEINSMCTLLRDELAAGAWGLSTGLEYDPGIASSTEEVIALANVLAENNRRYISHIRSEDRYLWPAIDEVIRIGAETGIPVQISHLKIARVSLWGQANALIAKLDSARRAGVQITADIYPYEYWQSTMTVLFPERNFEDLAAARYALTDLTTPEGMVIARYDPQPAYVGQTLAQIAAVEKRAPEVVYLNLIRRAREEGAAESVICTSMLPQDITDLLAWPYSNLCSDGGLNGRHPRGAGSFTKVLRQYVREEGRLSLARAIRTMSAQAAENLGIPERGKVAPGYFADLVLFDPQEVKDLATIAEPNLLSEGIQKVWVNGQLVWDGNATGVFPGKPILAR